MSGEEPILELEYELREGHLVLYQRADFGLGVNCLKVVSSAPFEKDADLGDVINFALNRMHYGAAKYSARELISGRNFEGKYKPK